MIYTERLSNLMRKFNRMKRILLLPAYVALLLPLPALSAVVTFDDWGGNVSADYTLTIRDDVTLNKFTIQADVDAGFTAAMLAIAFDVASPFDYDAGNLGLENAAPGPATPAFDTTVCNPSQGCNFNGATSDPFDVIVRFAAQGNGVASASFEIANLGGMTVNDFTRVGIRAQDTGPVECLRLRNCDSDKAISPPPVPEPTTLLLVGSGLLLLHRRAISIR